jgi:murein DD-endopeptidase MepM/ murein hydrolase activator NlpD
VKNLFVSKKREFIFIITSVVTIFVCFFLVRGYAPYSEGADDYFHLYINDVKIGDFSSYNEAQDLLLEARRNVSSRYVGMAFMNFDFRIDSENVLTGDVTPRDEALVAAEDVLISSLRETLSPSYTVKMGDYMVTLAGETEVVTLLNEAIDRYNPGGRFEVRLVRAPGRDFNVLTAEIVDTNEAGTADVNDLIPGGGLQNYLDRQGYEEETEEKPVTFQDFETGLISINFVEKIEIAEGYVPASQLTSLEQAIEDVTKQHDSAFEHVIQAGDTLSGISLIYNTPIEDLMALNPDTLPTQNATLHINDTIIINQPKSEVSIEHVERNYVDEDYDAEVIIIPRDDWYTTETNVIQQPSAGHHRAIVDQHFINDTEAEREILIEEIDIEAVPKIMERGTKIPPTYIKPIYGGRISSYFGYRNAPTAGATTYHRGVDWAVATGTSVMASSGGTVTQAGWSGSYGYMILITHPGGTQTRYAHLSKIFVSAGQTVSQGEVIGKTGNTGRSTGPHLHFEILIGGSPVNPLNYIS